MNKRRLLFWLVLACFGWVIITRTSEIEHIWATLQEANWKWVLVAALAQFVQFSFLTQVYHTTFGTVGVSSKWRNLFPVVLGFYFVNVVTPTVGMGGVALIVDDAAQRGQSPARAAAGTALAALGIYAALAVLLAFGLVYLAIYGTLTVLIIISAIFFVLFSGTIVYLLVLGYWREDKLSRFLYGIQRLVNRIVLRFRPEPALDMAWSGRIATEFTKGATAIGEKPGRLLLLLAISFGPHLANMVTLYTLFLAFGAEYITLPVLVTGYAVGQLISVSSPTPQGIGFVETIMPAALISLGVPAATAAVVVLTYRGLTFWLPLLFGFFVLRRLKSLGGDRSNGKPPEKPTPPPVKTRLSQLPRQPEEHHEPF
jgi:uncharacterized protein (TIRG00374 family)